MILKNFKNFYDELELIIEIILLVILVNFITNLNLYTGKMSQLLSEPESFNITGTLKNLNNAK